MEATYELISAARGVKQGSTDSFWRLYNKTLDDVYFQLHFTMADENEINPELEKLYITLARTYMTMGDAGNVVNWINEAVIRQLDSWLTGHCRDLFEAEEKGAFKPPVYQDLYIPALEGDEAVYTNAIMTFLNQLPPLFKFVLVVVYYDGYSSEEAADMLMLDKHVMLNRIDYIEKSLLNYMQDYCKTHGVAKKPITTQRIRSSLFELQKLYRYPYAEDLYNVIRVKAIH